MKRIIVSLLLVFVSYTVFSQNRSQVQDVIMYTGNGSMTLMQAPKKEKKTVGSMYLNDRWRPGVISLYGDVSVKNYPFKIDLRSFNVDINTESEVKVLMFNRVKSFEWFNNGVREKFISSKEIQGKAPKGFFKIIHEGDFSLYKYYKLNVISSNYNMALDVGTQNNRYDIDEFYFVCHNEQLKKIKLNKRNILKLFKNKENEIKEYVKENNLRYKDEIDMGLIFDYYNSL